jgi:cleavage and polyadenylation specificity factor subunit 1
MRKGLWFSLQIPGRRTTLPSSMQLQILKRLSSSEAVGDSLIDNTTTQEHRLHVIHKRCGRYFVIDCGSAIWVITSFVNHQVKPGFLKLYAANATEIDTYGEQKLELYLNLRISLKWNFVIANVQSPIIDADFLAHYGPLIDLKNHRLIDTVTSLKTDGEVYNTSEFGISTSKTLQYSGFLSHFMDVTTTPPSNGTSGASVLITFIPLDLQ